MSRFEKWASVAACAAIIASFGAAAEAKSSHSRFNAFAQSPGAVSQDQIRQNCYAEAARRWPGTNQDMNKNRDFTYQTCAFDHGLRP
jgi:hypothetical protein